MLATRQTILTCRDGWRVANFLVTCWRLPGNICCGKVTRKLLSWNSAISSNTPASDSGWWTTVWSHRWTSVSDTKLLLCSNSISPFCSGFMIVDQLHNLLIAICRTKSTLSWDGRQMICWSLSICRFVLQQVLQQITRDRNAGVLALIRTR